jgi:hypothetical protein
LVKLVAVLLLILTSVITAQDKPAIIYPKPFTIETGALTEAERKEILQRLGELQLLREKLILLQAYIDKDKEQDARDKALSDRELALASKELEISHQETALAKKEAADYKAAYETLTQKGGFSYGLCKALTLGLARCR